MVAVESDEIPYYGSRLRADGYFDWFFTMLILWRQHPPSRRPSGNSTGFYRVRVTDRGFHQESQIGDSGRTGRWYSLQVLPLWVNNLIAQVLRGIFNKHPLTRILAPSWAVNDNLSDVQLTTRAADIYSSLGASARGSSCSTHLQGDRTSSELSRSESGLFQILSSWREPAPRMQTGSFITEDTLYTDLEHCYGTWRDQSQS